MFSRCVLRKIIYTYPCIFTPELAILQNFTNCFTLFVSKKHTDFYKVFTSSPLRKQQVGTPKSGGVRRKWREGRKEGEEEEGRGEEEEAGRKDAKI